MKREYSNHYKKTGIKSVDDLMETIYWCQRRYHNYQHWTSEEYEEIAKSLDSIRESFNEVSK